MYNPEHNLHYLLFVIDTKSEKTIDLLFHVKKT